MHGVHFRVGTSIHTSFELNLALAIDIGDKGSTIAACIFQPCCWLGLSPMPLPDGVGGMMPASTQPMICPVVHAGSALFSSNFSVNSKLILEVVGTSKTHNTTEQSVESRDSTGLINFLSIVAQEIACDQVGSTCRTL